MVYAPTASAPLPAIQFRAELPPSIRRLTKRQREVFWLLSYGECNKAIARRMGVGEATIKAYVSAILLASGCANRTQAALIGMALREGLSTDKLKRS